MSRLAAFYVVLWLMVAFHEIGHALCAWLLGWRVFQIVIGSRGRVLQFRLRGVRWEINLLPWGGHVISAPRNIAHHNFKSFLIRLAGPAVNLAGLIIALSMLNSTATADWMPVSLLLGLPNLLLLAITLIPYTRTMADGQRVMSDGLALLKIPFWSEATAHDNHAYYFQVEGAQCLEDRHYEAARDWHEQALRLYPDDIDNRNSLALTLHIMKDNRGAREHWLINLANKDLPATLRSAILNNIACIDRFK